MSQSDWRTFYIAFPNTKLLISYQSDMELTSILSYLKKVLYLWNEKEEKGNLRTDGNCAKWSWSWKHIFFNKELECVTLLHIYVYFDILWIEKACTYSLTLYHQSYQTIGTRKPINPSKLMTFLAFPFMNDIQLKLWVIRLETVYC